LFTQSLRAGLYFVSQAPALTIDKETISESGYIIHRLLQLPSPNRAEVEETPSNDSVFWSHFSEGSQMNILQAERMVGATAAGVARGGVRVEGVGEEGRGAVGKYGKWVSVGTRSLAGDAADGT
jgi:glutathione S-transferase